MVFFFFFFFLDKNNRYTSRFLGFSVYISNTTNKGDGALCFKDNVYLTATIPNPVNITCIQNGRYVIFYNNRTHPPYPDGYSTYAYSELCEVQVYGKLILPQQNFFSDLSTLVAYQFQCIHVYSQHNMKTNKK